jgi:hypothetical protein
VGDCWLWSLIIFLVQRSLFSTVFIPHEDFTPQKNVHSSMRGSEKGCYLVNVYCNFIVNLDYVHYKVIDLMLEVMLGFFP